MLQPFKARILKRSGPEMKEVYVDLEIQVVKQQGEDRELKEMLFEMELSANSGSVRTHISLEGV